ncbi:collagen alpha-1(XIV) chain-like [Saccostrea echinata]|uniref:collagen alpha-1(XIV) chain-like n=1 Tax=Saccostrea echinata TaxID=191078 RepID=UPI002A8384F1|nr:collagen alpha-1(XIV) chain-like [Saccostrea echinata]
MWVLAVLFLASVTFCIQNDIVYVIDISGSLSQSDLNYSVDFLDDITQYLTIGPSDVKISIVTFSNVSTIRNDFTSLSSQADVITALQSLKSLTTAGGTKTYLALNDSYDLLTSGTGGMRSGVNKTVVVLTDGRSDNRLHTIEAANNLHDNGIEVFSVGVGSEVTYDKTELYDIASDPDSHYQHDIEDFTYLCNVVPALAVKLDPSLTAITLPPDCMTTTTTTASPKKKKATEAPTTQTTTTETTTVTEVTTTTTESPTTTTETTTESTTITSTVTSTPATTVTTTTSAVTSGAVTTLTTDTTTSANGTAGSSQSQRSVAKDDSSVSIPIIVVGATASLLLLSSIPGGYFLYKAALRRKIHQEEKEEEVRNAILPYQNSLPKHLGPGKPAWQT